ncbi:hypothetical protein [Segniliparus rugosus]|uniref:Secreted protein n=1 Tax=Segniliparus rugosus (strain ATCC BAA-974 / DSM 45345 / CCUG 50838 / CIP 108380 / JCM 13579 / CDC 945) TaxID=679197 RepID=E5XRL7_SEGRC|nr:hypothetical protein [Segniliparus rugosus]EFV12980.1 hypothetical protein HMPREF9336_02139 [Segniliparus rugosus ATCC BAA-974]
MRFAFFIALCALAGMFGAEANAAPAHSLSLAADGDEGEASSDDGDANDADNANDGDTIGTPSRPGGNTHYPRNGTTLHKDDDDESSQGAQNLDDALDTAGGQHPGH